MTNAARNIFSKFEIFVYSFLDQNSNVRFACNRKDYVILGHGWQGAKRVLKANLHLVLVAPFTGPFSDYLTQHG